jgi:hypothetical protein
MKQFVTEERLNTIIRESIQEALEESFINVGDGAQWLGKQAGRVVNGFKNVRDKFSSAYNNAVAPQQANQVANNHGDIPQPAANAQTTANNNDQNIYPSPENGFQGHVANSNPQQQQNTAQQAPQQSRNTNYKQAQDINAQRAQEARRANRALQRMTSQYAANAMGSMADAKFVAKAVREYMINHGLTGA